jgi:hypothetical protein
VAERRRHVGEDRRGCLIESVALERCQLRASDPWDRSRECQREVGRARLSEKSGCSGRAGFSPPLGRCVQRKCTKLDRIACLKPALLPALSKLLQLFTPSVTLAAA